MARSGGGDGLEVCTELGTRKVFASALDWPGWCRAGKNEEEALAALAAAAGRYSVVARRARVRFPFASAAAAATLRFAVGERLEGSAATDFGAPGAVAAAEHSPLSPAEARRRAALVRASWAVLDDVARSAPAELRKGPRGGGRDRDAILAHVLDAEVAYARKVGVRWPRIEPGDAASLEAFRDMLLAALVSPPNDGGGRLERGWPARYAARRIAWHVLDHAWEIEDRSDPAATGGR
jgi:hypothetical protein